MKKITKQSLLMVALSVFSMAICPSKSIARTNCIKFNQNKVWSSMISISDDQNIVVKATKQDWKVEVQISYDGDEGQKGKLIIYNSQKQLINEFEIELKKSPEFITLNLAEFSAGTYTVELITVNGKHTSNLIIK